MAYLFILFELGVCDCDYEYEYGSGDGQTRAARPRRRPNSRGRTRVRFRLQNAQVAFTCVKSGQGRDTRSSIDVKFDRCFTNSGNAITTSTGIFK